MPVVVEQIDKFFRERKPPHTSEKDIRRTFYAIVSEYPGGLIPWKMASMILGPQLADEFQLAQENDLDYDRLLLALGPAAINGYAAAPKKKRRTGTN